MAIETIHIQVKALYFSSWKVVVLQKRNLTPLY